VAIDWTDATENAQADEDAARCPYVSLHTAAPGATGANEATGGSPAYARKALTFNDAGLEGPLGVSQPATVGVAWGSAIFDVPADTFTDYGLWSAVSAGTFRGSGPIPVDGGVEFASQGTLAVSVAVGPNAPA
jgi:hypothetical protein